MIEFKQREIEDSSQGGEITPSLALFADVLVFVDGLVKYFAWQFRHCRTNGKCMSLHNQRKKQIGITAADLNGVNPPSGNIYEVESIGGEIELKLENEENDIEENTPEDEAADDDEEGGFADPQLWGPLGELHHYLDNFDIEDDDEPLRLVIPRSASAKEIVEAIERQKERQADPAGNDLAVLIQELEELIDRARETHKRIYMRVTN